MIEKNINGTILHCFEPSEKEAKKEFEKAMVSEDAIRRLTLALIEATADMEVQRRNAWINIRELLPEQYRDENGFELEYNWILGGFSVVPKN